MEQKELANRLHISNKTISSWECDRTEPNIGMFEKIADALNVTKAELLEGRCSPETIVVKDFGVVSKKPSSELSREEKHLIKLFRSAKYKEIVNLMMEKMS